MANVGELIYDDLQEAFASGSRGAGADIKRLRHWGFEPEQVPHPVRIWHGEEDKNISVAAARTLAARLPSASATFLPAEGHLNVLPGHIDEILSNV
jgi:pimeloyl-ACP methyl ester carboxylesterase